MSLGPPTCFSAGTLICTDNGDIPVESLKAGDMLLTLNGFKPVKWIGRRKFNFQALTELERSFNMPIRISKSALGEMFPNRDLIISACHSVVANGKMHTAGSLINGQSIHAIPDAQELDYYHLEFDDWELVLANGLPAESFVDVGNRVHFDNYQEWRLAHRSDSKAELADTTAI